MDERSLMRIHGDAQVRQGMVDLAVNVRGTCPPAFVGDRLRARIADLASYPAKDAEDAATLAVARRHGRDPSEVLLLAGAAEGFALLPRLSPRLAAVVHPSFTEPDLALVDAGIPVHRVILDEPWSLAGAVIPDAADLVVVGNPTNPTSVLHPAEGIRRLLRPGRVVVVDEAFMDTVPGEPESLSGESLPGLLVLRSLTKSFALAGLRCGYVLGEAPLLARLADSRPAWPLGTLQLEAIEACCSPEAIEWTAVEAGVIGAERAEMVGLLTAAGWRVRDAAASFVLAEPPRGWGSAGDVRVRAFAAGVAVRRCDTFPGLDGERLLRLAVRPCPQVLALLEAAAPSVGREAGKDTEEGLR